MEPSKPMTHITAGLLIAGMLFVYFIVISFLNLTTTAGINFIQYAIIIGGLIFVVKQYGKAHNYHESFGNLFAFGFKSTAVFTILYIVLLTVFFLLFPEIKEKSFEVARQQMEKQKSLSDEDIEKGIQMARKFFWVGVVGGTMFILVLLGAIGSAIGAALTKKNPYNPLDQLSV